MAPVTIALNLRVERAVRVLLEKVNGEDQGQTAA
jgi:hypothetical protein